MIQQAKTKKQLKIEDFRHAGNETNKVDKINPFHINMLLGQIIEIEETGYVRIVTDRVWEG